MLVHPRLPASVLANLMNPSARAASAKCEACVVIPAAHNTVQLQCTQLHTTRCSTVCRATHNTAQLQYAQVHTIRCSYSTPSYTQHGAAQYAQLHTMRCSDQHWARARRGAGSTLTVHAHKLVRALAWVLASAVKALNTTQHSISGPLAPSAACCPA